MPQLTNTELAVQEYYIATQSQYSNWGRYQDRLGLYAIHSGFHPNGELRGTSHEESLVEMERRILEWINIPCNVVYRIGDLGCGVGGITTLLATTYPNSEVLGVTITGIQAMIGQRYLITNNIQNALIANASYMRLPCPPEYFDRIIFIESLMHAPDKLEALKEAARTLKVGGLIHFQDPVLKTAPSTTHMKEKVRALWRGFCMPTFEETLDFFLSQWKMAGLIITKIAEISANVYPSAFLVSAHAKMRLNERKNAKDDKRERRIGGAVLEELMRGFEDGSNTVGYYVIQATKG